MLNEYNWIEVNTYIMYSFIWFCTSLPVSFSTCIVSDFLFLHFFVHLFFDIQMKQAMSESVTWSQLFAYYLTDFKMDEQW